jgi:hypothetical protein
MSTNHNILQISINYFKQYKTFYLAKKAHNAIIRHLIIRLKCLIQLNLLRWFKYCKLSKPCLGWHTWHSQY